MATVAQDLKEVDHKKAKKTEDVGQIPQWKLMVRRFKPVSYTHLDVYKRQG